MKIRASNCVLIIIVVLLGAGAWIKFTYPKFVHIDLSVTRSQAVTAARQFINQKEHADLSSYLTSVIFTSDSAADRYLQKSLGFAEEEKFIQKHHYDFFVWSIRFFKENQKEEFKIVVSSKTGEVLSYNHIIDDFAARSDTDEKTAQLKAEEFLKTQFGFDLTNDYTFHSKNSNKFDHRVEYTFNWEKKGVYVTWSKTSDAGGGKLLSTVAISGDDVLSFNKQIFGPPDPFNRYVESRKESGRNLSLVANVGILLFFIGSIWIMIIRRNHLAMNVTKRFYIGAVIVLFILSVISGFNNMQAFTFDYPTTQPLMPFLIRQVIYEIMDRFLFLICFIIPCLAGELLRFEHLPKRPQSGMFSYLTTTFLSRNVAATIILGYAFAVMMIGLQAVIFQCGYHYFDVWVEQDRLSRFSTGYFPFLGVLILAVSASFTEETFFRLFGINFGIKIFRSSIAAVLVSSILWGLGHTGYMVFPFWFRGLEVTILGIFTAIVYLRFGLICTIVVHFLFDAFWASAPYIFGRCANLDFVMSLAVLGLPFMFALVAFIINKPVVQISVAWRLNAQQKFNLEILKGFIGSRRQQESFSADALRQELVSKAGWDVAVVDVAMAQLQIPTSESTVTDT